MPSHALPADSPRKHGLAFLALGALGVVYGDIGTSPLYAFKECFHGPHALPVTEHNVFGILSLVFWSLILVISVKYLLYVMRADNRGEGGILALMALARSEDRSNSWLQMALVSLGLFGSALLYGDGIITPAITTLSAIEGLAVVTQAFHPFILPLSVAVLVLFFAFQRRGTTRIGSVFGPVMVIWFGILALLGVRQIVKMPSILAAANPWHAAIFFAENRWLGFLALGSVFLVVTGGEALYADMGHFGRRPIQVAWFWLVLPALLLNYFGQGSLLLRHPEAVENPFFHLSPEWFLVPLTVLATAAAVIASQAVISGAFSLTRQAVQLGYIPRVNIVHTSSEEIGQIYIPGLNWLMMLATIGLVLGFRSASALAGAYGIAVTSTMVITTILAYVMARRVWATHPVWAGLATAAFLLIDVAFFSANAAKILHGGWLPLFVAALVFLVMTTWKRGREILAERLASTSLPARALVEDSGRGLLARVPGTAVFLSSGAGSAPIALLHNVKHNRVLHERNVFLTVQTEEVPHVPKEQRLRVEELGNGFWSVIARYGFMEDPHLPQALRQAGDLGLDVDPQRATYFLSRNTLLPSKRPRMARWREHFFMLLSRNASRPPQFFRIPPHRVIELGMQVEL